MLGQLRVVIKDDTQSAKIWFSEGMFTQGKPYDVIHLENYSGALKILIVDDKNAYQYLDMGKVAHYEFIPLLKQVEQTVPKAAVKGRQVTLEDNIKEVSA